MTPDSKLIGGVLFVCCGSGCIGKVALLIGEGRASCKKQICIALVGEWFRRGAMRGCVTR